MFTFSVSHQMQCFHSVRIYVGQDTFWISNTGLSCKASTVRVVGKLSYNSLFIYIVSNHSKHYLMAHVRPRCADICLNQLRGEKWGGEQREESKTRNSCIHYYI